MSKRTGIDQAALSRLETGKNGNPTLDTLYRVTAALGKVICWSFQDADKASAREEYPLAGAAGR